MTQQMLILFAIFVDRAGKAPTGIADQQTQAVQAMAVFSFFLFLIYGFFGTLLATFRNSIIEDGKTIMHTYSFMKCSVIVLSVFNCFPIHTLCSHEFTYY